MTSCFDADWANRQHSRCSGTVADWGLSDHHVETARAVYSARRQRDRQFDGMDLFADPVWDLMLALLIDRADGKATSISSACIAACVPGTTGLRWIDKLVRMDLLSREDDPFDRRRSYLSLTPQACEMLGRALSTAPHRRLPKDFS